MSATIRRGTAVDDNRQKALAAAHDARRGRRVLAELHPAYLDVGARDVQLDPGDPWDAGELAHDGESQPRAAKAAGVNLNPEIVAGFSTPFILLTCWRMIQRIHQGLKEL